MSDGLIKRYKRVRGDAGYSDTMCVRADGEWVRWSDYAALQARAEKAEADNARLREALREIEQGWTVAADPDTGELIEVRMSEDEMIDIARAALASKEGGDA